MPVRAFLRCVFVVATTFLLSCCVPSSGNMIRTVHFASAEPGKNRCLLIFLPGIWDQPESFEREGFAAAVREAGLPVDMLGADAHVGYYVRKTFPERLRKDVIAPAKELGYDRIWLVGISMGGLGALWYDERYPDDVAGLVALAPYLGEAGICREVSDAGGLAAWDPPVVAGEDYQRQIWRLLKVFAHSDKTLERVYLGYGLKDEFAATNGVFSGVLPGKQVFTCTGDHDWATWRRLWAAILNELIRDHGDIRVRANK